MAQIDDKQVQRGGEDRTAGEDLSPAPLARRQRFLVLPPGLVLALCIFLPALRVCGKPTYPIAMPPFWSPYLLGVVVAILAASRTRAGLRGGLAAAQIVMGLTGFGWAAMALWAGPDAAPWGVVMVAAAVGFLVLARRGSLEQRAARVVIAIGVVCTPWFALLASDHDAMIGAWVSVVASIAIAVGGLEWWREERRLRRDAVPRAVARAA
jgi:hypothetical protein